MKNALDLLHEDEARATLAGHRGIERRSTSTLANPSASVINAFGAKTRSGASVSEDLAFNLSVVRACVDVRASLFASLPLHLYRYGKGSRGPQRISPMEHPLARLFARRVTPAHSSYQWRYISQVCHDIGGNSYTRIERNAFSEIAGLHWVKPADIQVRVDELASRLFYTWRGNQLRDFDVLKVSNLSTNGFTGRSPIADLRESVGLALTAEEFAAKLFANGNKRPGLFLGSDTMSRDKAEEFLKFYNANYAGAHNAGKQQLVWGMTWQDLGFSNADAELLLTRRFSVEEIARVYRLPLHLVGGTEKSTTWGSGIEQLNRGLVDYTLMPLLKSWEAEMDTILLSEREQDDGYYVKINVDGLLRGDLRARAEVYQKLRAIGAMDVNQIREMEEWPLYPDAWAGDPRQPLNAQGNAALAEPQPAPAGANDSEEDDV